MHRPTYQNNKDNRKMTQKNDQETKLDDEEKGSLKSYLISLGRDILIAVIVMVIVIGSLWLYTGNWPPMVVIESNSMMHGSDSNIGTIDTGDLVLVKNSRDDIKTYVEGKKSDYMTYDSYGDVIIFRKNGVDDTPVIHRAVVRVEYNKSGHNNDAKLQNYGSFDVPSLGLYNVTKFWISGYVPNGHNLTINLNELLKSFQKVGREPHGGYITKGDNNIQVDQLSTLTDKKGRPVEPVKEDWIVGKAEGELPWFGLIKLYISGETSQKSKTPPESSVRWLFVCIALIIIIPIVLDVSFTLIGKYLRKRKESESEEVPENKQQGWKGPPLTKEPLGQREPSYIPQNVQSRPIDKTPPPALRPEPQSPSVSKDDLLKKIK